MAPSNKPYSPVEERTHTDASSNHSEASEDIDFTELSASASPPRLGFLRIVLLTCPNFGLQILWLLLMSYGTPFLHSLGISNSVTALVWLAGPLSGAFLQPIFGTLSDKSDHPWGRRKPFILCGAVAVVFCLLALACTEDLTGDHIGIGLKPAAYGVKTEERSHLITQLLAIFWVFAINISIQPFQVGVRAFVVDSCPSNQQIQASAWCTRWNGLGSVFISLFGLSNTSKWAPYLGDSQFKALGVIAACSIVFTVTIVCFLIEDSPNYNEDRPQKDVRDLIIAPHTRLWRIVHELSPNCRQVCKVQCAAWLAWFPILYYTSTFIYQTFILHDHVHTGVGRESGPEEIGQSDYRLLEVARHDGSFAVFLFALVALITSILLPLFISRTHTLVGKWKQESTTILGMTLGKVWGLSHVLLAGCMFLTVFSWTVPFATGLIGVAGMSWAVASWIPFSIISFEVSRETELRSLDEELKPDEKSDHTATILGLQNMAISVPQIFSALVCAVMFKFFEIVDVRDGAAWVLRFSGVAACFAAYLTKELDL
ncbi:hypothetical protein IFR05_010796 [Cadophora sp. M221]|nr:hypothetical protein IFR05_010796 [Cadophora sp. M221]